MTNNWRDTSKLPPVGVEVEVSYIAPINELKYMGVATYLGEDEWLIFNSKIPTKNIICWQSETVFYNS